METEIYPIKKQVCSFEQAKRIFEMLCGYAPNSVWLWWKKSGVWVLGLRKASPYFGPKYPAYTGCELGAMTPAVIDGVRNSECYRVGPEVIYVSVAAIAGKIEVFLGHTEAEAKASRLIWLLENDHIKPEDIYYPG